MSLTPGSRLGSFEVVSALGAGGMGEVFRAHDTRLGRDVAIKALPAEFAQDPERLARFEREARLLASLSHPNIAGIFGVEEAGGSRYLVLEYVEGETLAERLTRGALPVDEALDVARQIAAGVEAAHESGVIHRDLKPGNVMLTGNDGVKVLDFGLARSGGGDRTGSDPNLTSSPTRTYVATQAGVVLGTAAYMSPEQARGKSVDRRTDIWSFGCVLFECLTGRPLFEGETVSDLIAKILQTEPDWNALPAMTPPRVRALLKRCLRRDPKERLRDIGDARIELAEIIAGGVTDAPAAALAARGSSAGRWRWIATGAVALAIVSVAALVLRRPEPVPVTRLNLVPPTPQANFGGLGTYAVAPNGRAIAFIAFQSDTPSRLMVRDLDDATARAINDTDGAGMPFWSPDSRHVGFFKDGKLCRVPAAGGGVQTLCDVPTPRGGSWGDGVIVFAPGTVGPLFKVADTGGTPVATTAIDTTRGEDSHRFPCFLPDGRHFVFGAHSGGEDRGNTIRIGAVDRPEAVALDVPGTCATFAAPDHVLFVRDQSVMAQRVDLDTFEPRGAAVVLDSDSRISPQILGSPVGSASHQGVLVLMADATRPTRLRWDYPDGRSESIVELERALVGPSLSPDESRAMFIWPEMGGFTNWIVDLTDGSATQIGQRGRGLRTPVWSPDGARVAGLSVDSGRNELRILDLGSGSDSLLVATANEWGITTDWSEHDRVLLFCPLIEGTGMDLRYVTMDPPRRMMTYRATPANEGGAALSPDGRWIAYWSDGSGSYDLVVDRFPEPGPTRRVSTGATSSAQVTSWQGSVWWSADGRTLLYARPGLAAVMTVDVRTEPTLALGPPRELFRPDAAGYGLDYAAAGHRFLVAEPIGDAVPPLVVIQNWPRLLEDGE